MGDINRKVDKNVAIVKGKPQNFARKISNFGKERVLRKTIEVIERSFTTEPKTRRHVRPRCISRDRAMAFMEYLFEEGFRGRMSYEALKTQFILFFGTNDRRVIDKYIGRPGRVERYGGSTRIVRMNRLSGKIAQFEYFNERRIPAKKGLMEILGYISVLENGIVILHHEGLPYFTRQASLDEVGSFERELSLQELENGEGSGSEFIKDDLCVCSIEAEESEMHREENGDREENKEKKEEVIDYAHTNPYYVTNMNRKFYDDRGSQEFRIFAAALREEPDKARIIWFATAYFATTAWEVCKMVLKDVLSTKLRIEELELGAFTPRLSVDYKYVAELAESLAAEGQLKPIIVRPHPEKPNCYQVIDGVHRLMAAKKLGWTLIRAEVRMMNDEEAMILAMRVNQLHGKRLDAIEEGLHLKKLMDKYGYTETQVAEKFRRSQAWVSQRLSLVEKASPELQRAVITRVIKPTVAREIAKLPEDVQPKVVEKVAKEGLSRRKVKVVVEAIKENPESAENVLAKPVEAFSAIVDSKEQLEKVLQMSPSAPIIEFFDCPCGEWRIAINWVTQQVKWSRKSE